MRGLLKFSNGVDWLNAQVGKWVIWLILGSTVISAINALVRKIFNTSSNAYLEVQWYLFAGAFLRGLIPDPTIKKVAKTPEEELAEELRRQAEAQGRL